MKRALLFLILLGTFFMPLLSQADESAVLQAVVNGEERAGIIVTITDDRDVLLEREDLKRLGFREGIPFRERDRGVSLSSIVGLSFEIDDETATLTITADPHLLRRHELSLKKETPFGAEYLRDNALAFNYSTGIHNDRAGTSLSGNLEVMARYGLPLFYSSFSYTQGEGLTRLLTNLTFDLPRDMHRLVIGDFTATSGGLGSGGTYGGFKFEKAFSLMPYLIRHPGPAVEGVLESPSTVEVYVNNALVRRLELPPGEFLLDELSTYAGRGDVRLIIRDAYGRQRTVEVPFYIPSTLLRPGLSEYSLALGMRRQAGGIRNFDYGDLSFLGFYRRGIRPWLTGMVRAEADQDVQNTGGGIDMVILNRAELDMEVALSHSGDGIGAGGSLRLHLPLMRWLSLDLNSRGFSSNYRDLSDNDSTGKPGLQASLGAHLVPGRMGSLSISYTMTDHYESEDTRALSLYYSKTVHGGNLYINAGRHWSDSAREDRIILGILIPLGRGHGMGISQTFQDGGEGTEVWVSRNPPQGPGGGYRVQINRDGDRDAGWRGYGHAEYHTGFMNLSGDYWRAEETESFTGTLAGSVVLDRGVHFGRPIRQGYAVVRTGLEGIRVRLNGREMGGTGRGGDLLLTELIPYSENTITLSLKELPLGYRLIESRRVVAPYYLSGGVVEFPVKALRAVEGRIYRMIDGKKEPVEYAGLEIVVEGKRKQTITGRDGVFYLEDIPAGHYSMEITTDSASCRAELEVPDTEEVVIDLGGLECRD